MPAKQVGRVLFDHPISNLKEASGRRAPAKDGSVTKGSGKPAFMPIPLRVVSDQSLTALELRVLGCISWHDRLSLHKGSAGCYASNLNMAEEVGCTVTSLSRAIGRLLKRGYLIRDYRTVPGKRHMTTYRVIHHPLTVVQRGKKYLSNKAIDGTEMTCPRDEAVSGTIARRNRKNGGKPPPKHDQDTSRREEKNSVETGKTRWIRCRGIQWELDEDAFREFLRREPNAEIIR